MSATGAPLSLLELRITPVPPSPLAQKRKIAMMMKTLHGKRKPAAPQKLVAIAPAVHTLDALYAPSETADVEAEAEQKMSCGDRESIERLRWEKLAATSESTALLEIRDVWFDAKTCAIASGPVTTLSLRAVAWDHGTPWLYAMRNPTGITLIMPRTSEISSESMIGAPVSVRGDFTRVTLPIGRWGSGSIATQLPVLSLRPAGAPGEKSENAQVEEQPADVGIDFLQTMSERSPTLIVRVRKSTAEAGDELRTHNAALE